MSDGDSAGAGEWESEREIAAGTRFGFGANWSRFLRGVDERAISEAERALRRMLEVDSLEGKSFLDIGSGSGLSSLAAHRLGARVHSFDFDRQSVACTEELKRRFHPNDPQWTIEAGSCLDDAFLARLGKFDVVYSWGVLHHTGHMWRALDNAMIPLKQPGTLLVAIYNDQGWASQYWKVVKRLYNKDRALAVVLSGLHAPVMVGGRAVVHGLRGRRSDDRGMSIWYDFVDWMGGYPFEVARPEDVVQFYRERGLYLSKMRTCGGRLGCNEFAFRRPSHDHLHGVSS